MFFLPLAVLVAAQAEAPAERLHVEWVAPDGCPSREELAPSLESSVPSHRTFHASVRIAEPEQAEAPWRAVVVTTAAGDERTRVVEGTDCARVSKAAVLVITLAATALPGSDDPPAPAAPPPSPADPEAPAAKPPPEPDASSDSGPFRYRFRVQPLAGTNVGLFPLPGVSVGLSTSLTTGRVRTQLAVADWLTIEPPGRGVRVSLQSLALKGCWVFEPSDSVRLGPCTGVEGGFLSAEGSGIVLPERNSVFWASALAGVTTGFPASKSISTWVTVCLCLRNDRRRG